MPEPQPERQPQLEYSRLQPLTTDRERRRAKADKIVAVINHFLGTEDLSGLHALDIGSSTGFTVGALSSAGAMAMGVDIDEGGLVWARQEVPGAERLFVADGARLPFGDQSLDVVVLNHIYEHVVDPEAIMAEIRRVLAPSGIAYLGLGNRLGVMEPHYRLPFLSWLPQSAADRYMQVAGRGDSYFERFRTRRGLLAMCRGLAVWDYTLPILAKPDYFAARDMVAGPVALLPPAAWRMLRPVLPTYIWVATPGSRSPAGVRTTPAPLRLTSHL